MTEVDARDLGILDWFIATVRERAGLRPLRTGERLRAWDYPPAPPPPDNTIRDASGAPLTRPLGPPTIDLSGYADAVDGLGAVVQIDRLRAALAEERLVRSALEAENAALRSQLADARGDYR